MLRSFLIGLTAGSRSLTPLAAVSEAARQGQLPNRQMRWLGNPLVSFGSKALAAGELLGDKWTKAPDRIVPAGIAARLVTGALAGAALAPRKQIALGAALGATAAVGAAFITFHARMAALRRYGQTSSGLVEDALTLAASEAVLLSGRRRR